MTWVTPRADTRRWFRCRARPIGPEANAGLRSQSAWAGRNPPGRGEGDPNARVGHGRPEAVIAAGQAADSPAGARAGGTGGCGPVVLVDAKPSTRMEGQA